MQADTGSCKLAVVPAVDSRQEVGQKGCKEVGSLAHPQKGMGQVGSHDALELRPQSIPSLWWQEAQQDLQRDPSTI